MKLKFTFLKLFLGCISLLLVDTKFTSSLVGEELPKIELTKEIQEGNFLIGLKQYLGGENDSFSSNKNIHFITDQGFLYLHSSNEISKNSSAKIFEPKLLEKENKKIQPKIILKRLNL